MDRTGTLSIRVRLQAFKWLTKDRDPSACGWGVLLAIRLEDSVRIGGDRYSLSMAFGLNFGREGEIKGEKTEGG